MLDFSNENAIHAVQNETILLETSLNATEEQKELAWKRRPTDYSYAISHGKTVRRSLVVLTSAG